MNGQPKASLLLSIRSAVAVTEVGYDEVIDAFERPEDWPEDMWIDEPSRSYLELTGDQLRSDYDFTQFGREWLKSITGELWNYGGDILVWVTRPSISIFEKKLTLFCEFFATSRQGARVANEGDDVRNIERTLASAEDDKRRLAELTASSTDPEEHPDHG